MQRAFFVLLVFFPTLAFGQGAPSSEKTDYSGFYNLNLPGFEWTPGAQVAAKYQRVTGVLNLEHTRMPVFVPEGSPPISLSVDQTSRILLAFNIEVPFDLEGIEVTATQGERITISFIALRAVSGNRVVNLIPTPRTPSKGGGQPGGAPGGPPRD